MRITNNIIMRNSMTNIGGTKGAVNTTNTQMTTQKKISRPSEDPVIAIRSLRLSTDLSKVNQYYERNIPDARSWMEVTETALINMKDLVTDMRTRAVYGAHDTLTQTDRNTILKELESLQDQIYMEGNSDYAGRTVFTGFRTNKDLVFAEAETKTAYSIDEKFNVAQAMEEMRYYSGDVKVPNTKAEVLGNDISDTVESNYNRIRLAYGKVDDLPTRIDMSTDGGVSTTGQVVTAYDSEEDWLAASTSDPKVKEVGDNDIVFIKETGEFIFGNEIASEWKTNNAELYVTYEKTGFDKGQLKPEYYFDCRDITDPLNPIEYEKYDANGEELGYDIDYTVASNQTITVNLEASDVFNNDIQRDLGDMISAVKVSLSAHEKLDKLKSMKEEAQYAGAEYQDKLKDWIAAAQKEADFADNNLQQLFEAEIGKADQYLEKMTLAITRIGCSQEQLTLTEKRMQEQQETVQELQARNDDMDLSEIIMKYTAAYTAYQASLQAGSKVGQLSLLNYL